MERRYVPYSKWLGTAFGELELAKKLTSTLIDILSAVNWKQRERLLSKAYSIVGAAHNKLGITPPLSTKSSNYFGRRYKVIHADKFSEEIRKAIKSPAVRKLKPHVGSVDQFTDSTDVLNDMKLCSDLKSVYR